MGQKKLKISLPTLRESNRYIKFQIISEEKISYSDLEGAILNTALDFYGERGFSELSLWVMKNLYDPASQVGVIRCSSRAVQKVIACLGLVSRLGDIRVIFKILKVSGTIKRLKVAQSKIK